MKISFNLTITGLNIDDKASLEGFSINYETEMDITEFKAYTEATIEMMNKLPSYLYDLQMAQKEADRA